MKRLNMSGDTIIEVLIAIAVMGLTVGGAYNVASRSLKSARQAQERGEALKIAEGQLETIRGIAMGVVDSDADVRGSGIFCLSGAERVGFTSNGWATDIKDIESDPLGDEYPDGCINGLYHVAVQATSSGNDTYQYQVVVRWFSFIGNNKEELRIRYRLYGGES